MQTKKESLREAIINVLSGYILGFIGFFTIYPMLGIKISFVQNIKVATFFVFLSLAKHYGWRRFWNHREFKKKGNLSCSCSKGIDSKTLL